MLISASHLLFCHCAESDSVFFTILSDIPTHR